MNSHRLKAYLTLLAVATIWGAAAVIIKLTLPGISPLPFLTYRFFLSSLIVLFSFRATAKLFRQPPKVLAAIFIYSFLVTTFALGFLFLGLARTTVLSMALISLANPLLIEYAGVIFLHEHITRREKIGTFIAIAGTLLTVLQPILKAGGDFGDLTGNILILFYFLGDIAAVIFLKKIVRNEVSPFQLTNFSFVVGFITILPIALFVMGPKVLIETVGSLAFPYHAGVWYMAFISGNLAFSLRAKAQKTIEVGEAGLFAYLVSVFSAPLAVLFLGETITPPFILGAAVIAVGVFIAEYKSRK